MFPAIADSLRTPMKTLRCTTLALSLLACTSLAFAQEKPVADDLTPGFKAPTRDSDFEKRVAMVPMRDGVKLYTVIVVPKGAKAAPILLTRTCYNAAGRATRSDSPRMIEALPLSDEVFVEAGYIRVYQDVRGKYGSEGPYLMTPPPVNSGFNPTGADDTTDAYDTIDWLTKNVPESNGRVGMIGSSYEGFTVVMALLHPHPALKVAAPESPMVDGWMGDDWFHYGAFRQVSLDYFLGQTTNRGAGVHVPREGRDEYSNYLRAGSAGDFARAQGQDQLPLWHTFEQHPDYDAFWQSQALDKLIAKVPQTVPTMWEQGLWDQEDMWGAIHSYRAFEPKDRKNNMNYLVMGPWRHSQINREGRTLGPFTWASDTTAYWRKCYGPAAVLQPIPKARIAQSRHAASPHLQPRRRPLGPPQRVPHKLRKGLPRRSEVPLSAPRGRALIHRPHHRRRRPRRAGTALRRIRLRPCQARPLSPAPHRHRRRRRLGQLAPHGPALRRRPPRRSNLRDRAAHRAHEALRRTRRTPLRVD